MREPIYKFGCWGCKRAWEAEEQGQKYLCPNLGQHREEFYRQQKEYHE